jgi:hypothetical protein
MGPRRFAVVGALCGTVVLASWVTARLAGLGEKTGAPIEDTRTTSVISRAEHVDVPPATAKGGDGVAVADRESGGAAVPGPHPMPLAATPPVLLAAVSTADPVQSDAEQAAGSVDAADLESRGAALPDPPPMLPAATPPVRLAAVSAADAMQSDAGHAAGSVEAVDLESLGATLPDPRPMLPAAAPPVQLAAVSTADPVQSDAPAAAISTEALEACLVSETCIDEYLWSLYQRTPKVDTNKVSERIKVIVKKKGKTRTVIKTITKYVEADFTWKDPIAAQKVGMSLKDYVIGGMDRGFRLKLYRALRAMDDAGLMPGITSAFRDDYRQSIASGNKAVSDSSYHGGSRRGGYGRGLAADLVSVKGDTRMQRYLSSQELWKWIDAHEKELGIGRPYLNRDPPHVGPIDGQEYADKRGRANVQKAGLQTKNAQRVALETPKRRLAARNDPGSTKPEVKPARHPFSLIVR